MTGVLIFNNGEFQRVLGIQRTGFSHTRFEQTSSGIPSLDDKIAKGVKEEEAHKGRCFAHLDQESKNGYQLIAKDKDSAQNIRTAFDQVKHQDKDDDPKGKSGPIKHEDTQKDPQGNPASGTKQRSEAPKVGEVTKPVNDGQNETDLKGKYPNGTTVTGDGKHIPGVSDSERPKVNGQPNLIGHGGQHPYRELPTGFGSDGHGKTWMLRSPVPYDAKKPDGSPAFWCGKTNIYDADNHFLGSVPLGQASMVVDHEQKTVAVIGNEGTGQGQRVMFTAPYDPAHPNGWVHHLTKFGDMPAGDRENQIIALKGGGYAFFSSTDNGGETSVFTAKTLDGLLAKNNPQATKLFAPAALGPFGNGAKQTLNYGYGVTVVKDVLDKNGHDIVTIGMSNWEPKLDPSTNRALYNPQTYTSTVTFH